MSQTNISHMKSLELSVGLISQLLLTMNWVKDKKQISADKDTGLSPAPWIEDYLAE